jgi:large subunit ribosomal protein L21
MGRIPRFANFPESLMYAIIEDGGKQHKVTSGETLLIDREISPDQKSITFDRVMLIGGEGEAKIGAPVLEGATVTADVIGPATGPKLFLQKYRRRKGYSKKQGHRQHYMQVKITGITA